MPKKESTLYKKEGVKFPLFLPYLKERTYTVLGFIGEVNEYKDNKGYIDPKTGYVYICSKDKPPLHDNTPVLYVDKDNHVIRTENVNAPNIMEAFHDEYVYDISLPTIVDTTAEDEVLYNEQALADINAATSKFVPIINEDDDPLKKIVKYVILAKDIDINRLKHKMPEKYALTNIKSALIGKTKMSVTNFNIWMELLGLNYELKLIDNGTDKETPLRIPITYSSKFDRFIEE